MAGFPCKNGEIWDGWRDAPIDGYLDTAINETCIPANAEAFGTARSVVVNHHPTFYHAGDLPRLLHCQGKEREDVELGIKIAALQTFVAS